jgi:hypothetical protein
MRTTQQFILSVILALGSVTSLHAQVNNLARVTPGTSTIRAYTGLEYGLVFGLHYGKAIGFRDKVLIPFIDASLPTGRSTFDDYRLKIGTSANILQRGHWAFSGDLAFIHRNFNVPFVAMQNVGIETGVQWGYYRKKAFVQLHLSNDYGFATRLEHTEAYKGNYPDAVDGWYSNTANNLSVGVNTGLSLKKMDITLSAGMIRTGGFSGLPSLPFFGKLGLNYRIGG